jgi:hypothetical protein
MRELTEEEYEKYLHEVEDRIIDSDNPLPLTAQLMGVDGKEVSYGGYHHVRLGRPEERNRDLNFGKISFPIATSDGGQVAGIAILDQRGIALFTQQIDPPLGVSTGLILQFELKVSTV